MNYQYRAMTILSEYVVCIYIHTIKIVHFALNSTFNIKSFTGVHVNTNINYIQMINCTFYTRCIIYVCLSCINPLFRMEDIFDLKSSFCELDILVLSTVHLHLTFNCSYFGVSNVNLQTRCSYLLNQVDF